MASMVFKFFSAINIILYFIVIAIWISIPDELTLNISTTIFNLCLTTILLYLKKEKIRFFYTSSYFKTFVNTSITISLIFCILGFVNYLAFKYIKQIDLTENLNNTLSRQTKDVLSSLDKPIKITIFAPKSNAAAYRALVELYRYEKNDTSINVIDPSLRPDLVNLHGITKTGTIMLAYGDKKELVTETSELSITNAIIRLSRKKLPSLYVLTGHGEKGLQDEQPEGFSSLNQILQQLSYDIKKVDLKSRDGIPNNIDLIVIWGPKNEFMQNELNHLEDFLKRGGHLLVGLDPDLNRPNVEGLRNLLKRHGIVIHNNLVIDLESHIDGSRGTVPLISTVDSTHTITKSLEGSIFFPIGSSIETVEQEGAESVLLALSSPFPGSWGEQNPKELLEDKVAFNQAQDIPGPVSLAVASSTKETKIVAFGNSTFVSNQYGKLSSNFSFFLNAVAWLTSDDQLPSINLPVIKNEPVFIGVPQLGIIFYFSVLFIPIILILLSIYFYYRRTSS